MSLRRRMQRAWNALTKPERRSQTYDGAGTGRLLADWVSMKMHPDDESRYQIDRLRVRARDLERNNPLARNFLRLVSVNVIGPHGVEFDANVKDNSGKRNEWVNERIEDAWETFCEHPTLDGKMDMAAMCRLLIKSIARDGEVFVRKWRGDFNAFGFALEPIDPDQVDHLYSRARGRGGNEIRMGVEVDDHGRPIAYWMWNTPERTFSNYEARKHIRVPADEIIHLYDPDRVNQTRGVTWFASVMVAMRMLEGYREAELVASRIAASASMFFEPSAPEGTPPESGDDGKFTMDIPEAGTANVLPEGYKLAQWHADHPSTAFSAFIKDQIRSIATGLGVSYNGLTSDLESVNYSSMRSGLLVEREQWRTLQRWWIAQFMAPVYRDWLNSALVVGGVSLDSRIATKFYDVRWTARGWPWVDPMKDTEAAVLGIQTGLMSRTQALAEQGLSYEDMLEDLKDETDTAKIAGVDVSGPKTAGGPKEAPGANGSGSETPAVPVAEGKSEPLPQAIADRLAFNGNGHAAGHHDDTPHVEVHLNSVEYPKGKKMKKVVEFIRDDNGLISGANVVEEEL